MDRLIVTEYPKSGGSWVTSMLGDMLDIPKRDIYVDNNFNLFDARKHPWYLGFESLSLTEKCVIKSHEMPHSDLIGFPAKYIHLVRDGRDVIVSKYFFEKDFCVNNGILEKFEYSFDEYVVVIAREWTDYVLAWSNKDIYTCCYEDFLIDPLSSLKKISNKLSLSVEEKIIKEAILSNTKAKTKESLSNTFKSNTFVRKGRRDDWRTLFSDKNLDDFMEISSVAMELLGYS